jgi:hypothetical protein
MSKKIAIEVIRDFKFAHRGCEVIEYTAGQTADVTERCAEIALGEKWAKPAKTGKAKAEAPENKAAVAAPENK